jgi:hypothetical protein
MNKIFHSSNDYWMHVRNILFKWRRISLQMGLLWSLQNGHFGQKWLFSWKIYHKTSQIDNLYSLLWNIIYINQGTLT